MSNYPDNIRDFDNHPSSPFFDGGPECEECGEYLECEVDADEGGYYTVTTCLNVDCPEFSDYKEKR